MKISDLSAGIHFIELTDKPFLIGEGIKTKKKFCVLITEGKSLYFFQKDSKTIQMLYIAYTQFNNFKIIPESKVSLLLKIEAEKLGLNAITNLPKLGTIGSDPEMFVEDEKGSLIPAFDFLGGKETTKNKTTAVMHGGYPLYWDGFQAEFETYGTGECLSWQIDSIQCGIEGLSKAAKKHNPNAKLSIKTVFDIPKKLLEESKEEHVSLGCMPSFNAYGMKGRETHPRALPFRSAGGHIHLGVGKLEEATMIRGVKTLDAILGVACVSLFEQFDDKRRREYYGLAGEYRLPKHGVEYRVLSNAWMMHPAISNLVFDLARKIFSMGVSDLSYLWKVKEEDVVKCINTCDVKLARRILKKNKAVLMAILKSLYYATASCNLAYKTILEGAQVVVENPNDIEGNWDVGKNWETHSDGKGKNWKTTKESKVA